MRVTFNELAELQLNEAIQYYERELSRGPSFRLQTSNFKLDASLSQLS